MKYLYVFCDNGLISVHIIYNYSKSAGFFLVMSSNPTRILLTGPPGIGKTTVIKKICDLLRDQISIVGFYTQEVRDKGQRSGFDVVSLHGEMSVLARKSDQVAAAQRKGMPTVGQYSVDLLSFEKTALPSMNPTNVTALIVVDEIGKMELFSRSFIKSLTYSFDKTSSNILATIPSLERGRLPPFVAHLTKRSDVKIITVTNMNRDELVSQITKEFLQPSRVKLEADIT